NAIKLLVNAETAYPVMLEEIEAAKDYILFQFYIFRCDETGLRFAQALMKKAREGVSVRFLYDEIGSKIPKKLVKEMKRAGIEVGQFNTTKGPKNRFQINFRNHRKLVLVDGRVAVAGGLNIGDEHLGKNPKYGAWRDTDVRLEGPAVLSFQTAFARDWFWSQGKMIKGNWQGQASESGDSKVLGLHTGPIDDFRTCLLVHLALINAATKRLWIATPYMVLPDTLGDALALAALRGVDVRLIVPSRSDNRVVLLASKVYQRELLVAGVRIFRYDAGFLHQKSMLIDDLVGVVGSANLDYRSMFLNFELSIISNDTVFVSELDTMFAGDFEHSTEIFSKDFEKRRFWPRLVEKCADLFAPIL
ncbi:MAG: cardiolipin synthase, partial [Bdellovibrionota bacterium]